MSAPPRRCFLALDPPDELRRQLGEVTARLEPRAPGVRWTRTTRLHLTLIFLGDLFDDALARMTPALRRIASLHPPLELELAGTGRFPLSPRRPARVLWCGASGEVERLSVLAARLREAAERAGVPDLRDDLHPHLTLGRVARPGRDGHRAARALEGLGELRPGAWRADELRLYQSPSEPGLGYRCLEAFPLARPPTRVSACGPGTSRPSR